MYNKEVIILKFAQIKVLIKFENTFIIRNPLIFTFRSVIGKELKKIACIFKKKKSCEDCIINKKCVYSFFFETPNFEKGNKKPHPYTLFIDFEHSKEINELTINLTLIGEDSISNFPYLFFAIVRAGERGIFRNREKYKVIDVFLNNESILIDTDSLNMDFKRKIFNLNTSFEQISSKNVNINFISPVRIRSGGKLLKMLDYLSFLKASFRRIDLLTKIYGECQISDFIDFSELPKIADENHSFKQERHYYYSSRQKRKILLIGIKGSINVTKKLTYLEQSLFEAASIFSIGSNTTFGFGKVNIAIK